MSAGPSHARRTAFRALCKQTRAMPHLHQDWAHPTNICAGNGLTPAHIRTGNGLTPATSAPRLGAPPYHISTGSGLTPGRSGRSCVPACRCSSAQRRFALSASAAAASVACEGKRSGRLGFACLLACLNVPCIPSGTCRVGRRFRAGASPTRFSGRGGRTHRALWNGGKLMRRMA